ncbi:hypothetical protein MUK42_21788 [Musa troglodytarum]|uniref:Uncharacterized protein n=1 Tax=Musa troglodytarum TaxID=320322 RepID=A0A9E7GEI0_9LILI|nr:hypothetical protein MUK42_21788 [Musa troglodytarum]
MQAISILWKEAVLHDNTPVPCFPFALQSKKKVLEEKAAGRNVERMRRATFKGNPKCYFGEPRAKK